MSFNSTNFITKLIAESISYLYKKSKIKWLSRQRGPVTQYYCKLPLGKNTKKHIYIILSKRTFDNPLFTGIKHTFYLDIYYPSKKSTSMALSELPEGLPGYKYLLVRTLHTDQFSVELVKLYGIIKYNNIINRESLDNFIYKLKRNTSERKLKWEESANKKSLIYYDIKDFKGLNVFIKVGIDDMLFIHLEGKRYYQIQHIDCKKHHLYGFLKSRTAELSI